MAFVAALLRWASASTATLHPLALVDGDIENTTVVTDPGCVQDSRSIATAQPGRAWGPHPPHPPSFHIQTGNSPVGISDWGDCGGAVGPAGWAFNSADLGAIGRGVTNSGRGQSSPGGRLEHTGAATTHARAGRLANLTSRHGHEPTVEPKRHPHHGTYSAAYWTPLRHADPADKADVYRKLGVHLTYDHQNALYWSVVSVFEGDQTQIPTLASCAQLQLP